MVTGSVHSVHLIQLSVFLKHKQSTPIKHMGGSHVGSDRWVSPSPVGFLHQGMWVGSNEQGEAHRNRVSNPAAHMVMDTDLLCSAVSSALLPSSPSFHFLTAYWSHPFLPCHSLDAAFSN